MAAIDTAFSALPRMRDRTVLIGGFSKAYAMTGWRIGYVAAPADLMAGIAKVHQYGIMCAPTPAQHAAIAALEVGEPFVQDMLAEYDRRRQLMVRRLNEIGLLCFEPMGAFYCFPEVTATGLSAEDFAQQLLAEEHVAVVPGEAFGPSGAGACPRLLRDRVRGHRGGDEPDRAVRRPAPRWRGGVRLERGDRHRLHDLGEVLEEMIPVNIEESLRHDDHRRAAPVNRDDAGPLLIVEVEIPMDWQRPEPDPPGAGLGARIDHCDGEVLECRSPADLDLLGRETSRPCRSARNAMNSAGWSRRSSCRRLSRRPRRSRR